MASTTVAAHAKVNLVLEVGRLRPDGYHEIDTVLQELELADEVTVTFGEWSGVRVSGPFADGTPADETNLAWRAAAALAQTGRRSLDGLGISLEKRIPPAGGLGGGASDAAAVLRILQEKWDATEADVLAAANAVGSDEAFFLVGGTARARGRGERVEALAPLPTHDVVLFIPSDTLDRKTGRLFDALDALKPEPMTASEAFATRDAALFASSEVMNSFERVARGVFPGLSGLWDATERAIGEEVHLAGAGPTLFWIGLAGEGERVAQAAKGLACEVVLTSTVRRGAERSSESLTP